MRRHDGAATDETIVSGRLNTAHVKTHILKILGNRIVQRSKTNSSSHACSSGGAPKHVYSDPKQIHQRKCARPIRLSPVLTEGGFFEATMF